VQKVEGRGLAWFGKGEYDKDVLILGLVPAQAFRASRSEAAPYGSDKRKIDFEVKEQRFHSRIAVCFKSWGSFQSVSSRYPQLRGSDSVCRAELCPEAFSEKAGNV
jgi:hypothetical protein